MKTTEVVESLSTIQPDVLFQRIPAYFKIQSTEWEQIYTFKLNTFTVFGVDFQSQQNSSLIKWEWVY